MFCIFLRQEDDDELGINTQFMTQVRKKLIYICTRGFCYFSAKLEFRYADRRVKHLLVALVFAEADASLSVKQVHCLMTARNILPWVCF